MTFLFSFNLFFLLVVVVVVVVVVKGYDRAWYAQGYIFISKYYWVLILLSIYPLYGVYLCNMTKN